MAEAVPAVPSGRLWQPPVGRWPAPADATHQGLVVRDSLGYFVVLPAVSAFHLVVDAAQDLNTAPPDDDKDELMADLGLGTEHTYAGVLSTLEGAESLRIPSALSSTFRQEVLGVTNRRMNSFAPTLKVAVEQRVLWHGEEYAPLSEWSAARCRIAWAACSEAEFNRWRVMVSDMLNVHSTIKDFEAGKPLPDPAMHVKMASGRASWTVVRMAGYCM